MFKLTKKETIDLAMELDLGGYNCGETVATALVRCLGYETDLFPRGGTAFGGGMGGEHLHQCGALTAGVLAAGIAFGRDKPDQSQDSAYTLATLFYNNFKTRFSTVTCYELVGLPPVSGDDWSFLYNNLNKRIECCEIIVRYAIERWYELAQELLKGCRV